MWGLFLFLCSLFLVLKFEIKKLLAKKKHEMLCRRGNMCIIVVLSVAVSITMLILGNNTFIFDRYLHEVETIEDISNNPDCKGLLDNAKTSVFYYSFVGCQLHYNVSKALHPGVNLIGDRGLNRGDIVLNNTYGFDSLGDKNREFLEFMCANEYWNKYDYFLKIDEDAIADYTRLIDPSYDLGCIWHNKDNPFCTGMLIYYSSSLLREACKSTTYLRGFKKHDDVQLTRWLLLSMQRLNKTDATCSLRSKTIIHKQYNSRRMNLFFTPYLKCTGN